MRDKEEPEIEVFCGAVWEHTSGFVPSWRVLVTHTHNHIKFMYYRPQDLATLSTVHIRQYNVERMNPGSGERSLWKTTLVWQVGPVSVSLSLLQDGYLTPSLPISAARPYTSCDRPYCTTAPPYDSFQNQKASSSRTVSSSLHKLWQTQNIP